MFLSIGAYAQPSNDDCNKAIVLPSAKDFCSNNNQYTTAGASASYLGSGSDVWFAFTPRDAYDLYITIYGAGNGGTLQSPVVRMFTDCTFNTGLIGSSNSVNNVTTFYRGGLKIGQTYYFNVSGANTGTFKLCFQNQNAIVKPGQDCMTARFLCSMETVRETNITGAGNNPDEGAGTCMEVSGSNTETNSAWFKWKAANNGTLVFTITPTVMSDDLDWALFDLGTSDNCGGPKTVIACANGSGVTCTPQQGYYYKTGLDFNSTDVREELGCVTGQDGKVKFVTMQKDHVYALLINNPYQQGNGFTIDFKDQNGKAGTGLFVGPEAIMDFKSNDECTLSQSFIFNSLSKDYTTLSWDFGEGANIPTATTPGPHTITYSSGGTKTVVLEARGDRGCYTLATHTFAVGIKPSPPVIQSNKPDFCLKDTIRLSTDSIPGVTYEWSGPNSFSSDQRQPIIPIRNHTDGGLYSLVLRDGDCVSDPGSITIPPIRKNPVAAFNTLPSLPAKLSSPVTVQFLNHSQEADTFLWDFGDGTTSSEENPIHTYMAVGDYNVTLTAFKSNICSTSTTQGKFVIRADNTQFIPNTFSPNGDGANDEFVVTLTNLNSYRIKIFSRWGSQLFESGNIFDNWKGLFNGEPLPVGVYYYLIDAVDLRGTAITRSGYVTLLR